MSANEGLDLAVSSAGVFLRFIASDGSETHIDALDVIEGSSALTNKPLVEWYRERLQEASQEALPDEARACLTALIDEIEAFSDAELKDALQAGAGVEEIERMDPELLEEWLEQVERQVAGASHVLLTGEVFSALLAIAKGRFEIKRPAA